MSTPSLKKLHHAIVLAESQSYAIASERLHLTQSALTRSIQSLEEEIGVHLFDRGPQGVRTTPDGASVLEKARQLMLHANTFDHEVNALRQIETGELSVGFGPGTRSLFLPHIVVDICRQRPGLSVSIEIDSARRLASMLLDERLEFFIADAVHLDTGESPLLETRHLTSLPIHLFVRKNHPLAAKKMSRARLLAAIGDFPMISGQAPEVRHPSAFIRCNDLVTLQELVKNTDGIFVGIASMMAGSVDSGAVVQIPGAHSEQRSIEVSLIKLRSRTLSRSASLMEKLIRQRIDAI